MSYPFNSKHTQSNAWLERALHTIPTGSQTFSKAHIQFPQGHAPLFVEEGRGAHITDVDGNDYVDLIMGLAAVGLGYRDPDVDAAIATQLAKGITFSLPTRLEAELAELLVECVPSAEMVRFGKNGSDATTAAVRLARAFTGRDLVIACSYHGWHDWYIGSTTRNLGVPDVVGKLTHSCPAGDIEWIERFFDAHQGQVACIIVEPMLLPRPPETLAAIAKLARANGAVLIFDEVATGFRFSLGGAQELYGVTPDLSAFGKSMANGMPLSAIVGRKDIMMLMEQIFFSGSFGGEALSLAASIATIKKLRSEKVVEHIWDYGSKIQAGMRATIARHRLEPFIDVLNEPCLGFISVKGTAEIEQPVMRTFMLSEMISRGVFMNGSITVCQAFKDPELDRVLTAFEEFGSELRRHLDRGDATLGMDYPPIRPIFSVRKARDG